MGLSSIFATVGLLSQAYLGSSIKLLILGSVVETGRHPSLKCTPDAGEHLAALAQLHRLRNQLTAQVVRQDMGRPNGQGQH
ncbi:hypothetical protein B0H10DRAFT_1975492 [Mycena sp. CBHHK59/15]|nr:hypothetical protein B0H10DRAFT_1975492 [Mycena sp. CBHHK59/15]